MLRIRGGDLTRRGANLSLQDHGADVWFRNLRRRAIPASERLASENLTPMRIPDGALRKEQARIDTMFAGQRGAWRHEELKRIQAEEAHQGVAVDEQHVYAITNAAIGKYRKDTGERVAGWQETRGRIKHLNAGIVLDGRLWCAHDAQELDVLDLPVGGDAWTWRAAIPISPHGQAFAWDRGQPGVLCIPSTAKRRK